MFKGLVSATVLSGILMTGAGGAAFASAGPAAPAHPGHARLAAGAPRHAHKRVQRHHRRASRAVLRVTAVNGNTINAVTRGDLPVTITVGAATTYREAGKPTASLSDVTVGESIIARGARPAPRTIQAKVVRILLARVAGVVTAVNGSTLTVTTPLGAQRSVTIASTAAITRAGATAPASSITPNIVIVAAGTPNGDGSLTATRILIRAAHVAGKVTAVDGATITLQGGYGVTYTVSTSSATVYVARHGKTLTPATSIAVTPGRHIVAFGARGTDGKTLTAARIVIGRLGAR